MKGVRKMILPRKNGFSIALFALFMVFGQLFAQNIKFGLNAKELFLDEGLQLSVSISGIKGGQIPIPNFPNIPGLQNGGSSQNQSWINGAHSIEFSRSYYASKPGKYKIPSFSYTVGGKTAQSEAMTITFKEGSSGKQKSQQNAYDPFQGFFNDPFFGGRQQQQAQQPLKFKSLDADYFLSVNLNKEECYIGEQVQGDVVLYILYQDARKIKVDGQAIAEMQQRIKNNGFWQEIIELRDIQGTRVEINGKYYIAYTLYKNILFPIKSGDIEFKDIYLDGMKLAVATNADPVTRFMGRDTKFESIRIKASDRKLAVKKLPPTSIKDALLVGKFQMEAGLNKKKVETGDNLELELKIKGTGNMAMMPDPIIDFPPSFETYEPSSQFNTKIKGSTMMGEKTFKWSMLPTRSGNFELGPIKFYFFDPEKNDYDSLQVPAMAVTVEGEDIENQRIGEAGSDQFYDALIKDNGGKVKSESDASKLLLYGGLAGFAGLMGFAFVRQRKAKQQAKQTPVNQDIWGN